MSEWVEACWRACADGEAAVLVTVADVHGSAPREAGVSMLITRDGPRGTIGGGNLEFQAMAIARDMLEERAGGAVRVEHLALGASLGQCCGGRVRLLFQRATAADTWLAALREAGERRVDAALVVVTAAAEPRADLVGRRLVLVDGAIEQGIGDDTVDNALAGAARARLETGPDPAGFIDGAGALADITAFVLPVRSVDFEVVLFGAGHVGRALVDVLAGLPLRLTWVETREGQLPASLPQSVRPVFTADAEALVDEAPAGAYFLVMTHSHAIDQRLALRILRRGDFAYFGLIGSMTKRRRFETAFRRRGIAAATIGRMTCPIGIDGITGKHPAEIAVAAAAQILKVREDLAKDASPGLDESA